MDTVLSQFPSTPIFGAYFQESCYSPISFFLSSKLFFCNTFAYHSSVRILYHFNFWHRWTYFIRMHLRVDYVEENWAERADYTCYEVLCDNRNFVNFRVLSNTRVNSFQHRISCSSVQRPSYLPSVCILLVVLKSHMLLSVLFKEVKATFSYLLTFTERVILIIFLCLRFENVILYFRSCLQTLMNLISGSWNFNETSCFVLKLLTT